MDSENSMKQNITPLPRFMNKLWNLCKVTGWNPGISLLPHNLGKGASKLP